MQWVSEITAITRKLRIFVYYGDTRGSSDVGVPQLNRRLTRDDKLFDGSSLNARTVVITSYQTLNQRHGPPAVKAWCASKQMSCSDQLEQPPSDFPFSLQGCFADVILDEAHALRNPLASQSKAVYWLEAQFYLLLSATLIYNSSDDFRGYMPLLFTQPSNWVEPDGDDVFQLDVSHPMQHLCCTVEAVEKFVLDPEVRADITGDRLRTVLSHLMIRRTLSSHMPFDSPTSIGADIPPVQRKVITTELNDAEGAMYKDLSTAYKRGLFTPSPVDPARYVWNMKKLRKLVLLTSWLGFHYVDQSLHAASIPVVCQKLPTRKVAAALAKGIQTESILDPKSLRHFFEHASSVTQERHTWTLEFLLRGSPKMRAMLPILRDQVILYGEKAIIWTQFPAEQVYVAATLYEANIPAEVFHAGLSVNERAALVQRFTRERQLCPVLVCSYGVNAAGLNLQNLCRNVHLFSTGMSKSVVDQAVGRVCRIGQQRIVLVYEYRLENSFNTVLISRNKLKSIPGLIAEMAQDEFRPNNSTLEMGRWVVRDGVAHRLVEDEAPLEEDQTDPEIVLDALVGLCE